MYKSKYSTVLTIVLIIVIIILLIIAAIVIAKTVKNNIDKRQQQQVFSDFLDESDEENSNNTVNENFTPLEIETDDNLLDSNNTTEQSEGSRRKVTYYPDTNFVVSGILEIDAINLKLSILEKETAKSLEKSLAIRYPTNAQLNTEGNVVIVGHNYRDGRFFSNLKKVVVGDRIKVTDASKKVITYEIYEIFETTPEDTAYMTRNTEGRIEISLSTCTDDGKARLIVLARQV